LTGDFTSSAVAINSSGMIVGSSSGSTAQTAVQFVGGVAVSLGRLPGGNTSVALGVNNLGQAVGYGNTVVNGPKHAVLYSGASPIDIGSLPSPGVPTTFQDSRALDINDSGDVVGQSTVSISTGF